MNKSALIFAASFGLIITPLTGCNSGGEYKAAVQQPASGNKPKTANCQDTKVTANLLDAQKAMAEFAIDYGDSFIAAFTLGNNLFEASFTADQGGGANVGGHERYTRVPRADRECKGEWAKHVPKRATGPNAQSCMDCHARPNDGAGSNAGNAQRDPLHSGDISKFIQRNTPHLFGGGAVQLLAQDMTDELHAIQSQAGAEACKTGQAVQKSLTSKTVNFGQVKAVCKNGKPSYVVSAKGISPDLIVKPFQWKKSMRTVRDFVLDASHNEIGMQAVELPGIGPNVDGDGDGVVNELTVSQVTALTVYMAAQPRPTTRSELTDWDIFDMYQDQVKLPYQKVTSGERQEIKRGEAVFANIGCAECHKPQLTLDKAKKIFKEGKGGNSVSFDITKGMMGGGTPDNPESKNGHVLGAFSETDDQGNIVIRLYGDLKRHDMGQELAEAIDENDLGRSTFGTKELWGVGCSGPWLHDGRATTLTEAIRYHGGEAAGSRSKFNALSKDDKAELFAFLYNQVLFLHEFGEDLPSDRGVCGKVEDEFKSL